MENVDIKTIYNELKECIFTYEKQLTYLFEIKNTNNITNKRWNLYKNNYDEELIIKIDKIHKKSLHLIDNKKLNYEVNKTKSNIIDDNHSTYGYDDCGIQ